MPQQFLESVGELYENKSIETSITIMAFVVIGMVVVRIVVGILVVLAH